MTLCAAMGPAARPGFLKVGGRRLFTMSYGPVPPALPSGSVLFVPPFGEEMNKSRRMIARQARLLAGHGMAVLVPDLFGTGDSEGDFGEATWATWCDDLAGCAEALMGECPRDLTVWAMRTGALLATTALDSGRIDASRLLLWQPVTNGESYFNHLLRLRLAAGLQGEGPRTTTDELREQLDREGSLEVAGYRLSQDLLHPLREAHLEALQGRPVQGVVWLELGGALGRGLSPASERMIERWRAEGTDVVAESLEGPPFWATQEIVEAPSLLDRTSAHLAP